MSNIDVKRAIETGDAEALRRLLSENCSRANELILWGVNGCVSTHPLHYISDMLFEGTLARGKELPLVDALLEAGAEVDFRKNKGETALIGAASLGAENVGLRLLEAGGRPELLGIFGETALHWAAMLGEARLVRRLIPGADLNLRDAKYKSPPLGWAIHGWSNPPAGNCCGQREVTELLVTAGARVEPEWVERARSDLAMLAALQTVPR